MDRAIVGFHLDEYDDWVADLECHHGQHVRHKPPFVNRPWVETDAGRRSKLGMNLNCLRCDRLELPSDLRLVRQTPEFTETTIPNGLLKNHTTKAGTWGVIRVLEGELLYETQAPSSQRLILSPGSEGAIPPGLLHRVESVGRVRFQVEFYHQPAKAA